MCLNNSQNVSNLLLLVFSHEGIKITESCFFFKFVARESSFHKSTDYKNKDFIKIFHESQINRKVKALVPDPGGSLKDYADLYKAQSLRTDLANMDANTWLRKFVKEVADSDGEGVSNKDPLWNYLWHPKAFRRNYRKRTGCLAD